MNGNTFGIIYFLGWFGSGLVLYIRAGVPIGTRSAQYWLRNVGWFFMTGFKAMVWPATFAHWVLNGCKPSRWKAVTRLNGREIRKIIRVDSQGA